MVRSISKGYPIIPFLAPLTIFVLIVAVSKSSLITSHSQELSLAITIDLLLTAPLVYFLLLRTTSIPKITVVPIFGVGILIASLILPSDGRFLLDLAKTWVLPLVELFVAVFIFLKIRKTVALFRRESVHEPDFYSALNKVCKELLPPRVDAIFAMEMSIFYYTFFAWKGRKLTSTEFTYHRESSTSILLGVFLFVLLIETFVVHLLLQNWSNLVAWILTIISIYTAFQLFAILKSLRRRPVIVGEKALFLKYGLFADTAIPFNKIKSIELSSRTMTFDKLTRHLSPLKETDSHNVILELKDDHELTGLYGMKRKFRTIAFHIDEKECFQEAVTLKLA